MMPNCFSSAVSIAQWHTTQSPPSLPLTSVWSDSTQLVTSVVSHSPTVAGPSMLNLYTLCRSVGFLVIVCRSVGLSICRSTSMTSKLPMDGRSAIGTEPRVSDESMHIPETCTT